MKSVEGDEIHQEVRKSYGEIAKAGGTGCGCTPSSCCGAVDSPTAEDISVRLGYSQDDVSSAPKGANMGLGCGNPHAIASLRRGESVLDLGSGGGFDCFLAAKAVGEEGLVIGVDMTPEMIHKARENAAKAGIDNVEFRLGEIEHLPASDNSIDVIISNCVINLSPEKPNVLKEAFRVLKPGGRLAVTDIVATARFSDKVRDDLALHVGCVAGASQMDELTAMLENAGFADVRVEAIEGSEELIRQWLKGRHIEASIVSATIEAVKPLE